MSDLTILYKDEVLIAIDKPKGMVVHAGKKPIEREYVAMKVLKDQIGMFVHTIHRLDRPTSGVLLFALESEAGKAMHRQFAEHKIQKQYLAAVRGETPESWQCAEPLQTKSDEKWRECETHFKRLHLLPPGALAEDPANGYTLVEASPVSGRHHQIRQHLASAGFPIVGDYLYGDEDQNNDLAEKTGITRMMLHAWKLTFLHPVSGEPVLIEAPMPPDFFKFAPSPKSG